MSGSNPYMDSTEPPPPQQNFKIRFLLGGTPSEDVTVEVDVNELELPLEGILGSILDIAVRNDIDVDHSCGGVCACSTCHVIVREGLESCNEATDDEEDMLDTAPGLQVKSRLACQCVPDGTKDLVVEIPEWNRNFVKESH